MAGILGPGYAAAQIGDESTFQDSGTERLFLAAREHWQASEGRILSYEAVRQDRVAADLRTPLRDRNLFHSEAAVRVRWGSDSTIVIQTLASSATALGEIEEVGDLNGLGQVFDPDGDRIVFGLELWDEVDVGEESEGRGDGDGGPVIEHPIAPGSEEHYRYRSGDTLTVTLMDGRRLEVVGLEMIPRERSGRLLSGILWIEPGTGALVRASYRLSTPRDLEVEGLETDDPEAEGFPWWAPGIIRPIQFDLSLVVVEYSNWNLRYWLPRRVRAEGWARAGIFRVPIAFEQTYQILDVVGADDATDDGPGGGLDDRMESAEEVANRWLADGEALGGAPYEVVSDDEDEEADGDEANDEDDGGDEDEEGEEDGGIQTIILAPEDRDLLAGSDRLPPPIWDDTGDFGSDDELESELRSLLQLPLPDRRAGRPVLRWGPQRTDLLRYNRVEGLAMGASLSGAIPTPIGPVAADATVRTGLGTWVTSGGIDLSWYDGSHEFAVSGYSRVSAVDPRARSLGLGNSATALLFGRDDGDYYRATGASLAWQPSGRGRPWYRIVVATEEHADLPVTTDFAVSSLLGGSDDPFRSGLDADEGREHSVAVHLEPTWGADPAGVVGGIELMVQSGFGADEWTRGRLLGRVAVPLFWDLRVALEAEGGHSTGALTRQRSWFLGGARTLRGYEGASLVGPTFGRGRVELGRGSGVARVNLFTDAGWAGVPALWDPDSALISAGAGLSLFDGLLRLDVARALRVSDDWTVGLLVDWIL